MLAEWSAIGDQNDDLHKEWMKPKRWLQRWLQRWQTVQFSNLMPKQMMQADLKRQTMNPKPSNTDVHDVPKDSSNVKQMHTIYTLKVACSCCDTDILLGVDGRNQDLFHDVDGLGCSCRPLLRSWWQSKLLWNISLLCDVLIPP